MTIHSANPSAAQANAPRITATVSMAGDMRRRKPSRDCANGSRHRRNTGNRNATSPNRDAARIPAMTAITRMPPTIRATAVGSNTMPVRPSNPTDKTSVRRSMTTAGADAETGTPARRFNQTLFSNSPAFPGVMDRASPATNTDALTEWDTRMSSARRYIAHRR